MVENNELVNQETFDDDNQLKIVSSSNFESYLTELGLPSSNILAPVHEKEQMALNIPSVILRIPESQRKNATYLSKFVSSVAIGRYDSALNDLWNEVVLNLRNKVCVYGLDIFFDAAVGENIRDLYSSEKDLPSIKDRVLLDTCLKLEIISNIVHQKLVLTSLKKRMNQIYNLNIIFKYVFKYGLVHPKHLSLNGWTIKVSN